MPGAAISASRDHISWADSVFTQRTHSNQSPSEFDGLAARIPSGSSQYITGGATLTENMLDELIDSVDAQGGRKYLVMSKSARRALTRLARGSNQIDITRNENLVGGRFIRKSVVISEMSSPLIEAIADILERGLASGEFQHNADPLQLYVSVVALCSHHLNNAHTLSAAFGTAPDITARVQEYLIYLAPIVLLGAQRFYYTGLLVQARLTGWVTVLNLTFLVAVIVGLGVLAFRDPHGIRPVVIGQRTSTHGGVEYMVASESVCMDVLDFSNMGSVNPGEMIFFRPGKEPERVDIDGRGKAPCIFEYIYFARPDSNINDHEVYDVRLQLGRLLAEE